MMNRPADVDEYIAGFPADVQTLLQQMRAVVQQNAPGAEECISYGMPMYKLNGRLMYFAAHTRHIGLYPMVSGIIKFQEELSVYKGARGSVQFPFKQPLPLDLIARIITFRAGENVQKAAMKKK